ncbi:MAG: DUF2845 domain-containing protein [Gammaproteobacteria bacterium]|nr:DUF2845 domain-containing protein [Gammaproteobacteria bacterium]
MNIKWRLKALHIVVYIAGFIITATCFAEQQPFYCPKNHGYVRIGMTEAQVLSACGEPTSKVKSKHAAVEQVPVTQLIYSTLNPDPVYRGYELIYNTWSLPVGSYGNNLEVDIIDNKISNIRFNGKDTNASSVCSNRSFAVGDLADKVFSACGNPSLTNKSFINRTVKSKSKPETWTYYIDQYQPTFKLIFMDGKLRAIE